LRINKIAAGSLLAVVSSGSILLASATPASAVNFATATASPNSNLVQGQTITVTTSGFPASDVGGTMYVFECASQALATQDVSYCDTTVADSNNTQTFVASGTGAGGPSPFNVVTGSNFKPTHAGAACGFNSNPAATSNHCFVVVSDTATQTDTTTVAPASISFKDTRSATKTKVSGPKKAKAGGKLKLKAKTTGGAALSGSVVFKDGKKKIAKVKEKASGVVKAVEKKLKPGKHKITATYSGNSKNKGSKGTLKVKVKK
jgi:hypothetical protein